MDTSLRSSCQAFNERYEFALQDARHESGRRAGRVEPNCGDPMAVFRGAIVAVGLTDQDVEKNRAHFKGVDAVIYNDWIHRDTTPPNVPVQGLEDRPRTVRIAITKNATISPWHFMSSN
jgi:hypothetical protein